MSTELNLTTKEHLKVLKSENPEKIKEAIEFLSGQNKNAELKEKLIERIKYSYKYEDSSPLWAVIILDEMKNPEFIPVFLEIFDTEEDFMEEAAIDALVHLERAFFGSVIPELFDFIKDRISHDPHSARTAGYNILEAFVKQEEVKQFLIQMFEEDRDRQDFIAGILAESGDKRLLELFKRGLEFFKEIDDEYAYNEIKWAYFDLARGKSYLKDRKFPPLWDLTWEKRWNSLFKDMEKSDEEKEKEIKEMKSELKNFSKENIPEEEKKEMQEFKKYSTPPFFLEKYLKIRVRSFIEKNFQTTLVLLGLSDEWTVEKIQKLINKAKEPSEALDLLLEDFKFPSEDSMRVFLNLFQIFWNNTPREELNGLTPDEKAEVFSYE